MVTLDKVRALASQLPRSYEALVRWVRVRLSALDEDEMRELVVDAWTMVVPKRVAADYLGAVAPTEEGPPGGTGPGTATR